MRQLDWEKENLFDIAGKVINRWMEEEGLSLSEVVSGTIRIPSNLLGERVCQVKYELTGDSVYLTKARGVGNTIAYLTDQKMIAGISKVHSYERRRLKLLQSVCLEVK